MFKYKVVCAWCGETIEEKETDDPKMDGQVSHGMCVRCFMKWEEKEFQGVKRGAISFMVPKNPEDEKMIQRILDRSRSEYVFYPPSDEVEGIIESDLSDAGKASALRDLVENQVSYIYKTTGVLVRTVILNPRWESTLRATCKLVLGICYYVTEPGVPSDIEPTIPF